MNKDNYEPNYDDIIDLPHHVSPTRPRMSNHDRAAQFSPFAALTGYDEFIREEARLTEEMELLCEDEAERIDSCLSLIVRHIDEKPQAAIEYFIPDLCKDGGKYVTVCDRVVKVDQISKTITTSGGTVVPIPMIRRINCIVSETGNDDV